MPAERNARAAFKRCSRCDDVLPLECFNADSTKSDGRYPKCKVCRSSAHAVMKVQIWATCACGKLFKPRHNFGRHVKHCSRACGVAAKAWAAENNPNWSQTPSYMALHRRLRSTRENPTECVQCGAGGRIEWALNHAANPTTIPSEFGPYSTSADDYLPMCVPCHRRMDARWRREAGEPTFLPGYGDQEVAPVAPGLRPDDCRLRAALTQEERGVTRSLEDDLYVHRIASRELLKQLEESERRRHRLADALATVRHLDVGGCPLPEDPSDRDPQCPACQALVEYGDDL